MVFEIDEVLSTYGERGLEILIVGLVVVRAVVKSVALSAVRPRISHRQQIMFTIKKANLST
jgi:hypothetical protein